MHGPTTAHQMNYTSQMQTAGFYQNVGYNHNTRAINGCVPGTQSTMMQVPAQYPTPPVSTVPMQQPYMSAQNLNNICQQPQMNHSRHPMVYNRQPQVLPQTTYNSGHSTLNMQQYSPPSQVPVSTWQGGYRPTIHSPPQLQQPQMMQPQQPNVQPNASYEPTMISQNPFTRAAVQNKQPYGAVKEELSSPGPLENIDELSEFAANTLKQVAAKNQEKLKLLYSQRDPVCVKLLQDSNNGNKCLDLQIPTSSTTTSIIQMSPPDLIEISDEEEDMALAMAVSKKKKRKISHNQQPQEMPAKPLNLSSASSPIIQTPPSIDVYHSGNTQFQHSRNTGYQVPNRVVGTQHETCRVVSTYPTSTECMSPTGPPPPLIPISNVFSEGGPQTNNPGNNNTSPVSENRMTDCELESMWESIQRCTYDINKLKAFIVHHKNQQGCMCQMEQMESLNSCYQQTLRQLHTLCFGSKEAQHDLDEVSQMQRTEEFLKGWINIATTCIQSMKVAVDSISRCNSPQTSPTQVQKGQKRKVTTVNRTNVEIPLPKNVRSHKTVRHPPVHKARCGSENISNTVQPNMIQNNNLSNVVNPNLVQKQFTNSDVNMNSLAQFSVNQHQKVHDLRTLGAQGQKRSVPSPSRQVSMELRKLLRENEENKSIDRRKLFSLAHQFNLSYNIVKNLYIAEMVSLKFC